MHPQWELLRTEFYVMNDFDFMHQCDVTLMKDTMLGNCKDCHGPLTVYSREIATHPELLQAGSTKLPNFSIEVCYATCFHCHQTKWAKASLYNHDDCLCLQRQFSTALPKIS